MKNFFKSIIPVIFFFLSMTFFMVPFSSENAIDKTIDLITVSPDTTVEIRRSTSYIKFRSMYDIVSPGDNVTFMYYKGMIVEVDSVLIICGQDMDIKSSSGDDKLSTLKSHTCLSGSSVSLQGPLNSLTLITGTTAYQLNLEY